MEAKSEDNGNLGVEKQYFSSAFPLGDSLRFSSHFRGQMQILRCLFNLMEGEKLQNGEILEKLEYCLTLMIELNDQVFANEYNDAVNLSVYLTSTARCLEKIFHGVKFHVECPDDFFSANKAFCIGLLLPEFLAGYYFKFNRKPSQRIIIGFAIAQGRWRLTIPAVETIPVKNSGCRCGSNEYSKILTRSLVEQLEARFECKEDALALSGELKKNDRIPPN